ncbi:p53 apoptosis effector related to PMP-22-like [Argopecten irradians]|uniref:p53 apoptosis effector related to PMP-22-like n=1 Tax=Argopecten irradians TaxID=31199 RepID=UPI00371C0717
MVDSAVVKIRPIKLIAVIFSGITVILLISSIAGKEWVEVKFHHDNRQSITWGLWDICEGNSCSSNTTDWVKVCATFSIVSLLFSVVVVGCGILGLCSLDIPRRKLFYIIAGGIVTLVALSDLLSLIIFPIKFRESIQTFINVKRWDFDWTYGFGWGGFIFSVAAAVFFFLPIDDNDMETKSF